MSLLEADGISAGYRDRKVFRKLSLSLQEGERVGLCGDNGSGKTTLLWSLVGLIPLVSGTIRWRGRSCENETDWISLRREATLLFQDPDDQLFCPTVMEDVAFGPCNLGLSMEQAESRSMAVLEQLGLSSYASRMSHKLSGGEKRLVSLACVLAMEPKMLLLDEPLANLDVQSAARVRKILAEIPCGFLLVSHDMCLLSEVTTRILRMTRDGMLQEIA